MVENFKAVICEEKEYPIPPGSTQTKFPEIDQLALGQSTAYPLCYYKSVSVRCNNIRNRTKGAKRFTIRTVLEDGVALVRVWRLE